jgi:exopolyphosphatase/guanosine-5'-triphosphate,3'-diphosphate pyrophosphatase
MSQVVSTIPAEPVTPPQLYAVIDVGSTSIRMVIAEMWADGRIKHHEVLAKAVGLGRDTFTTRQIKRATIEECVVILTKYRKRLQEYQIKPANIRIVATSAVREAENRLLFLDRVFVATGLEIAVLDDSEVHRIMYMGLMPILRDHPMLAKQQTIVMEMGGGNTEILILHGHNIVYSHAFRLGSQRLRETLEVFRAPDNKFLQLLENQIVHTFEILPEILDMNRPIELIALGGDIRFASARLQPDATNDTLVRLPLVSLENFSRRLATHSVEELTRVYPLAFQDAETVVPALMAYSIVARLIKLNDLKVCSVNLRDGLLQDLATREKWSSELEDQIIRSAIQVARKYHVDEEHAMHVAELARKLFEQLTEYHRLEARYLRILYVSALLHEIGLFISNFAYHKHSQYLITNCELFGMSQQDLVLVSLITRYHRRSPPKSTHTPFMILTRDQRITVLKLAALLRVSIALNASRNQRIQQFQCHQERNRLVINIDQTEDVTNEQIALRQSGSMFEDVFGLIPQIRAKI